ncbi:MAG: 50S ribosomal protein L32 [Candidatus Shikimatogenerans sp. Tder]|uniref:Large ribosomal subunit protein bL32 n=1 Tax=Candidatus Shikimatogenerans sp. Tder TaxID=3158566 RepID=A0AAU7QRL9_9FLAO
MANPKRKTSKSKKKIRRYYNNQKKKKNKISLDKNKNIFHISHNAYKIGKYYYYKNLIIFKK